MPTPIDELTIEIDAKANDANNAIDSLCKKIDTLTTSISKLDVGKLNSLGSGIKRLGDSLQTMKSVDARSISSVVNKINSLSAIDTSKFATVSANLHQMANGIQSLGTVSANAVSVGELANNISKLGNKSVQTAIANIPQLATSLNGLMTTLSHAPRVSQNVIQMTNALANLTAQGSKVGSASNSIVKGLNRASNSAIKANKSFKGLASTFGRFYANCFLVIRGVKKLWESIESSMDYIETSNYFEVSLSQISKQFERYGYKSAEAYGEALEAGLSNLNSKLTGYTLGASGEALFSGDVGLGMDIESMMNFQAKTLAVTNSVGLLGNASLETTKALSMLVGDLSSLTNLDVESVMNSLSSGLIGQSRALYKFGIDITNNTLQQYALAEGIDKAVSEMTQSEKMQLRLLAILDQSQVAWGDLGNTVNSVANQYRVFEQQIGNLGRTLGNLFLPIVKNVLPYVNGLIIALNNLFTSLGFDLWGDSWLEDLQDGISGSVTDDLEDIGDAADDALESMNELVKGVRGFDVLNVISTGSSTSNRGGVTDELQGTIDLTESITKAVANYENAWNKAFETAENKASEFAANISNSLEPVKQLFADIKIGDWFAVGEDVSSLTRGIFDYFSNAIAGVSWEDIGQNIGEFINGISWGDVLSDTVNLKLQIIASLANTLSTAIDEIDWVEIGADIGSSLKEIDWKEALSAVGELIWEALNAAIELWKGSFDAAPVETTIVTAVAALTFSGVTLPNLLTGVTAAATTALTGGISISEILLTVGEWSFSNPVGAELGIKILDESEDWIRENFGEKILTYMGESLTILTTSGIGFIFGGPIGALAGAIIGLFIDGFSTDGYARKVLNAIAENVFNFSDAKYFFDKMKENFTNALNGSNIFEVGGNIVEGILNGMVGTLVGIAEPFVDLFNWIVDGICDLFGIHSPAKETEFIGKNIVLGIAEGFTAGFKALKEKFKELWNGIADFLNEKMSFTIDPITILGKTVFAGATIDLGFIPRFENGGYVTPNMPNRYSILMAGENGIPEIAGTVGGRTAVAGGAEITGISDTIRETSNEEIALLRQQNALLQALLEKEFGISQNDIGKAAQNWARERQRAGKSAFVF